MILGPDDPRAITDPDELAELRQYTEGWNEVLGIKPLTLAEQKAKEARLDAILDLIADVREGELIKDRNGRILTWACVCGRTLCPRPGMRLPCCGDE